MAKGVASSRLASFAEIANVSLINSTRLEMLTHETKNQENVLFLPVLGSTTSYRVRITWRQR